MSKIIFTFIRFIIIIILNLNMTENEPIDIVIPWVDGNNVEWQERYKQYAKLSKDGDKRVIRFRDWGLLRYWFRGIECFAPWVRKIHFITSGELPEWLDINHPKIHWVRHEDYIPKEYLPTFSSRTIEVNLHRIEGLSEKFIYVNDDMFLLREAPISDFFRNGLPCDSAVLDPIFPIESPELFTNGIMAINRNFNKNMVIRKNLSKWINLKYGGFLIKSLLLLPWKKFPGLLGHHLHQSFRKKTFEEVWTAEPDLLRNAGITRFRYYKDVNQWIFRYWHLAKGEFSPVNKFTDGKNVDITTDTIDDICNIIRMQKCKQICINDSENITDFDGLSKKIQSAFNSILPQKSSFEKE
ncbi:stealth family protein [Dysgonomonas sp. 520]|uniref:stealth family protein n=1 Tax=Dysgonomonas sp. 520 TaxID=2302931 RepID=UPI0013CFE40F|nr:stealth family protein [Dysgonomonas sp. 520]NDW08199.1 glycosyl transferase [Dysgonomonas sp. 520]